MGNEPLVTQFWEEQRLSHGSREDRLRAGSEAWNAVDDQVEQGDPAVVDLLVALAEATPTDDDAGLIGAGPIEELISVHSGRLGTADGAELLEALETAARRHPRFRSALRSAFLGDEVPDVVRERLQRF